MSRVLVTGGSGFIGTNLVEAYRSRGDSVLSLDIDSPRAPAHRAVWSQVDLLDAAAVERAIRDFAPDFVFHMGARTDLRGETPSEYRANTTGVENVVRILRDQIGLRLAVFASSMLVCRIGYRPKDEFDYCPSTAYGHSKVEGERIVREGAAQHFPWVIVRPTSIWGPWFRSPYRDFFTAVRRGVYVHPRHRRIRRSYGFVFNTVAQLMRLAELEGGSLRGRTCYLADYQPIELKRWADGIQEEFDARKVREVPLWILRAAAKGGDALKRLNLLSSPPITSFRLSNLLTEMIHDTKPLHAVCGETPYSMEDGIRLTVDWMRSHP